MGRSFSLAGAPGNLAAMRTPSQSRPRTISLQRLGEHRGTRRLWIEGRKLERGGIAPGDRFSIRWEPGTSTVVLDFNEAGDRRVSKRTRNGRDMPIVDVSTQDVAEALGPGIDRAKVSIFERRIEVTVHPDDLAARERVDRLVSKVRSGNPLSTGSVAHGGGILDHAIHEGMREAGVTARLAFAVEVDGATIDAAATNNPIWDEDTIGLHASMDEVALEDLPQVDVLVAGLPCVGASRSGKAKNAIELAEQHETAGHLFVTFLAMVKAVNPAVVLLENVPDYANTVSATVIRKALQVRGYEVQEAVLDGNEMGALEMRRRWCMLATSRDLALRLDQVRPARLKEATLAEILDDVPLDSDQWRSIVHMFEKAERDRAKGANFSPNFAAPGDGSVRSMGASYWKWRPTEPKLAHPTRPGVARLLTPAEHARAKTVPPELVSGLSNTLAHQILGNSVVHAAWKAVGTLIGERMLALAQGHPPAKVELGRGFDVAGPEPATQGDEDVDDIDDVAIMAP